MHTETVNTAGVIDARYESASYASANASGVSWGAVFAGAAAAAALSFILLILGVGLGLSSIAPYSYNAAPLGATTIAWLAFMQLAASGIGGYIAGRLRVKWSSIHTDEVHFRDTAHGLLAWAVATLITVAVLAGGARAVLSGAIDSGAAASNAVSTAAGGAMKNDGANGNPLDYFSDMLLRPGAGGDQPQAPITDAQRAEVGRIMVSAMAAGALPAEDRAYLGTVVAKRAGVAPADGERRVDEIYSRASKAAADAKAKLTQAADEARKTGARAALWMFVALLLGAFVASLAATFGGRNRDHERVLLRA